MTDPTGPGPTDPIGTGPTDPAGAGPGDAVGPADAAGLAAGDLAALGAEPADLDGHTIEELAEYVDRGRTPPDPSIDGSPSCRSALAALERLRTASRTFLAEPALPEEDAAAEERWLAGVMNRIALDARAGADVVLLDTPAGDRVVITEGALRALVRGAGDEQPGFLVGRVRFTGDLADPDSPVVVGIDVVVLHGRSIPAGTAALRAAVLDRLRTHTRLRDPRVDIAVRDLMTPEEPA